MGVSRITLGESKLGKLKDTVQDCNLNFLVGSGASMPFLSTLSNIEILLTELDGSTATESQKTLIRASLYRRYFDNVIGKNIDILNDAPDSVNVANDYASFIRTINLLMHHRKSSVLSKQVNLFT